MTRDTDTRPDRDRGADAGLEPELRELIAERAIVRPEELEPLRAFVAALPARRSRRRTGLLAAAAGIVVMLGLGALVVTNLPLGTSGAAPSAPDPAAFAGDPRLAVCSATPADATAIFEMAHLRDYPLHLPAAYPLLGLKADPEAPALVIVFKGRGSVDRGGETPAPGSHDLCMVVGADPASWQPIAVIGVDTTGLVAYLPEPTGTPLPSALAAWADRCGGPQAGILAIVRLVKGGDDTATIGLDPVPAELATAPAGVVVVYDTTHPFPPLATPPPGASSPLPRNPPGPGHHDICVLVGPDPASARRFIHEDVAVVLAPTPTAATPTPAPITPSGSIATLPPQLDPAECTRSSLALDRCLAIVETGRIDMALDWATIARVTILTPGPGPDPAGATIATVTFLLRNGATVVQEVRCDGAHASGLPVCSGPSSSP